MDIDVIDEGKKIGKAEEAPFQGPLVIVTVLDQLLSSFQLESQL